MKKHGVCANRRHPSVLNIILLPRLGLKNHGYTQASSLWTAMIPPAAGLLSPDPHGQPVPTTADSVGGGGSGDRRDPRRGVHDPHSPFLDGPQGWSGPVLGEVLRTGDTLFPSSSCIGGGPNPRPGSDDLVWGRPG